MSNPAKILDMISILFYGIWGERFQPRAIERVKLSAVKAVEGIGVKGISGYARFIGSMISS